jgi:hypothetical protein
MDQWKLRTHGNNASQKPIKNREHKALVSIIGYGIYFKPMDDGSMVPMDDY